MHILIGGFSALFLHYVAVSASRFLVFLRILGASAVAELSVPRRSLAAGCGAPGAVCCSPSPRAVLGGRGVAGLLLRSAVRLRWAEPVRGLAGRSWAEPLPEPEPGQAYPRGIGGRGGRGK